MKKVSMFLMLFASLFVVSFSGCGSGETTVVEVPEEVEDSSAMEGMDDDEYNKEMNESMKNQGN